MVQLSLHPNFHTYMTENESIMQTSYEAGVAPAMMDMTSYLSSKPDAALRQSRRLPERILIAAHEACDLGNLDVAAQLLLTLERVIIQEGFVGKPQNRRTIEKMITAHHRLWQLRFDDGASAEPIGQMPSFRGDHVSKVSGE